MMDNKIESEAKLETLWSVLSRYDIVIPRMQRDYAQGRKTQDAKRIRTEFIKEIFDALIKFAANDNTTPLDLNFIYGNVENDIFYPIDGQQRLTTLYLLYWYLASYQSKGNIEACIKDILKRFKYQSRDIGNEWDFRRFLRNDNKDKRLTLQYLLDSISDISTENDIRNELDRIISVNMIQAQNTCSGDRYKWLKILVDDPDILESFDPDAGWSNDVVFKNASRYIRVVNLDNSGDENHRIETVYLLERTVLNSNHREIFTYELYLTAKRAGLNVKYKVESSTDVLNSIEFVDKSNHTIQILYGRYTNGQIAYLAKDVTLAGNDLFAEDIQKSYVGASIGDAMVYISGRIKISDSEGTNE